MDQAMDKQAVARAFSRAAATYDAAAHLQRRVADRLLAHVATLRLGAGPTVADLGTGTGYCLAPLKRQFEPRALHALDSSAAMLAQAQKKCPTCHPCLADLEDLPFSDDSHDLLLSNLAVQWLATPRRLLAEARRVLRPGGFLALTTLGPATLDELRRAWLRADDAPHVNAFLPLGRWRDAAEEAGLRVERWQEEQIRVMYRDPLELLRELKRLGASHVEGRRIGAARTGLQRMLEGYRQFRLDDGLYPATWQVLTLIVERL